MEEPKRYLEKISIQIAAYRGDFLEDAILSVISQDCDDWELIILVDGPPKEDSIKINHAIEKFISNPKIKVYVQTNQGEGVARTKLYEMTDCRYILPLDDDDLLTQDAVREVLLKFRQNQDAAIARGGIVSISENARYADKFDIPDHFNPKERLIELGMTTNITYVDQLWCFNKEIYDKTDKVKLHPETAILGVEIELFLIMEEQGPIVWIPKVLYLKRQWSRQSTKTPQFSNSLTNYCFMIAQDAIKRRKLDVNLVWDLKFKVFKKSIQKN